MRRLRPWTPSPSRDKDSALKDSLLIGPKRIMRGAAFARTAGFIPAWLSRPRPKATVYGCSQSHACALQCCIRAYKVTPICI